MLTESNMNRLTTMCGVSLCIINIVHSVGLSPDKLIVEKYDRKFNFYDIFSLYMTTLAMLTDTLVLLFLIESLNTNALQTIIKK